MPSYRPFLDASKAAPCLAALVLLWTAPAQAADTADLRREVADLEEKVVRAAALVEVLETERRLLGPATARDRAAETAPGAAALRLIRDQLQSSAEGRRKALTRLAADAAKDRDQALDRWEKARSAAERARARLEEARERGEAEAEEAQAASLPDPPVWLIIVAGAGAFLVACWLAAHVHRVRLRERWKSGLAAKLLALAGLAAVPLDLPAERDRLTVELGRLNTRATEARRAVEQRRGELLRAWKDALSAPADASAPQAGQAVVRWEEEALELLRATLVDSRIAELAAARGLTLLEQATKDEAALPGAAAPVAPPDPAIARLKLGLSVGLFGVAFLPLVLGRWLGKRRIAVEAGQCPRCLAEGPLSAQGPDVTCSRCRYKFPDDYRRLPRLCFPTVGLSQSGKTHWLVAAYDQINTNNVVISGSVETAPSQATPEFDTLIKEVLEMHRNPESTRRGLPAPLTFHVRDTDRPENSRTMLNLFDFSGEMQDERIDHSEMRRRALMMDGFILFLDPTQVTGQGQGVGLDYQIRQVARFRDDMRKMRGLGVGEHLRVPVAVCVSKLDLLLKRNIGGGQVRDWVAQLRGTAGWPLTLQSLHERSTMLADVMPVLFPGWNVARALSESFGEQFLYFPLTPVGIEDREPTSEDNGLLPYDPFGVVEPIIWLLHMRGYKVLS